MIDEESCASRVKTIAGDLLPSETVVETATGIDGEEVK